MVAAPLRSIFLFQRYYCCFATFILTFEMRRIAFDHTVSGFSASLSSAALFFLPASAGYASCFSYRPTAIGAFGCLRARSNWFAPITALLCIERLWRDVWTAVTSVYYDVLHYLEEGNYLDIADQTHLFCCHYTFVPRLQDDLDIFRDGWDNHPLRTEGNMTPNQLWAIGHVYKPVQEPQNEEVLDIPEIDWESSGLPHIRNAGIHVPATGCPLTAEQFTALRDFIDPRATSQSRGADIYMAAVQFCQALLE
ncbi:uncharacterized protein LOC134326193 [Trichomycterus rosablanca]|uniref:uncharacterized protein LOC134326193 n=1 Tax=Trichomycterus rosablanca TaxID=2290929 RepID=UPI002F3563C0